MADQRVKQSGFSFELEELSKKFEGKKEPDKKPSECTKEQIYKYQK